MKIMFEFSTSSVKDMNWLTLYKSNFFIVVLCCLVVGKLFSQVATHQGPLLAWVYLWYTNNEWTKGKVR